MALPLPDSARLLRLLPGQGDEPIKCTLDPVLLLPPDSLPSYEALSYVWHLYPGTRDITIDGHKKSVTENLFEALKQLRYDKEERVMWVDALCVNQDDKKEKSKQVQLMHHVYRNAERVIVWLGRNDYHEAHGAFSLLCTLANQLSATRFTYSLPEQPGVDVVSDEVPERGDPAYMLAYGLFVNVWWTRMWVLQEITLAKRAVFHWGDAVLDWMVIRYAVVYVKTQPIMHMYFSYRGFANASIMNQVSLNHTGEKPRSFLDLLDLSRAFDVTEPQDKIFALLGFPTRDMDGKEDDELFVEPDCSLSVEEIYIQTAVQLVKKYRNLDIFSFLPHTDPEMSMLRYPSWVPDWCSEDVVFPFSGVVGEGQDYKVGMGKEIDFALLENLDLTKGVLPLKGVIVDTITDVQDGVPFQEEPDDVLKRIKVVMDWCKERVKDLSVETFYRTYTAARMKDGKLEDNVETHLCDFAALLEEMSEQYPGEQFFPKDALRLMALAIPGEAKLAQTAIWKFEAYRSMFVTKEGRLGFGPSAASPGDKVVQLWGGQVLYVLKKAKHGQWRIAGEAYIDKLVDGQVPIPAGEEVTFELV